MKIYLNKNLYFSYKKPLIIAEISSNHCGDKKRFIRHIKMAKKSGADLVKIQTYEEEDICINPKFLKKNKNVSKIKKLYNLYKKAKTPFSWHEEAFKLQENLNRNL